MSNAEPETRQPQKSGEIPMAVLFSLVPGAKSPERVEKQSRWTRASKRSLLAHSLSFPGFEVKHFPFLLIMQEFGAFFFKLYLLSKFFCEAELVEAMFFFLS